MELFHRRGLESKAIPVAERGLTRQNVDALNLKFEMYVRGVEEI
jgi:hypothetical protein